MDGEWDRDGYEVLRGAAAADAIARYGEQREAARERLRTRATGAQEVVLGGEGGALDPHAEVPAALELLLAGPVVERLREHLGGAPLLFDAAEAAAGAPDDGPHRDATYTGLDDPEAPLVTVVVALGETAIAVHPGSPRLELPRFSGRFRHHNAERDGTAALDAHRSALLQGAGEPQDVALAAGDVALLHGDLAHGPVRGEALVGHCCAVSAAPTWFAYRPQRAVRVPHGGAWYASLHADLRDEPGATEGVPGPAVAPAPPARAPDAERVQEHLQQPGRRAAGLVGRVRGVMGRRPQR
jgi:hypothetical protein